MMAGNQMIEDSSTMDTTDYEVSTVEIRMDENELISESLHRELSRRVNKIIDERVAKFIKELPRKVDSILEKGLLNLMGVDTAWHEYRISERSGQSNPIADLIMRRLRAYLDESAIDTVIKKKLKVTKLTIDAVSRSVGYTLERALEDRIKRGAEALGDRVGQEVVKQMELRKFSFDLLENGKGLVHDMLLEEAAREAAERNADVESEE